MTYYRCSNKVAELIESRKPWQDPMSQYDRLLLMAEDELTKFSSDARKIEILRRKIGLSVSRAEQKKVREQLKAEIPTDMINNIILEQRQAVALPFWGIAGLGLLLGISMFQPLDFIFTVGGAAAAIGLQKYGWKLYAKTIVLETLEAIEDATNPASPPKPAIDPRNETSR
jgi:hypothetical protein